MDVPFRDSRPSDSTTVQALRLLTRSLDDPGADLGHMFDAVTERFGDAVGSLVAVMVTITVDDHPFTITSQTIGDEDIVSTVLIPLVASGTTTCVLILAASTPNAFTTLAHDAASELGVAAGIEHDGHRHLFVESGVDALSDLAARSSVDQAVGILLERGFRGTVSEAKATLEADAARAGVSLVDVARAMIDNSVTGVPNRPE